MLHNIAVNSVRLWNFFQDSEQNLDIASDHITVEKRAAEMSCFMKNVKSSLVPVTFFVLVILDWHVSV